MSNVRRLEHVGARSQRFAFRRRLLLRLAPLSGLRSNASGCEKRRALSYTEVSMKFAAPPACPACGFTVFNRRYPKCESCGVELPESLVYTAAERRALLEAEEQQRKPEAKDESSPVGTDLVSSAGEAAVMYWPWWRRLVALVP